MHNNKEQIPTQTLARNEQSGQEMAYGSDIEILRGAIDLYPNYPIDSSFYDRPMFNTSPWMFFPDIGFDLYEAYENLGIFGPEQTSPKSSRAQVNHDAAKVLQP